MPGMDFAESLAPAVNDRSFCILLVAMLVWGLKGRIIDMETAFLHGDLEEETMWRFLLEWRLMQMNV